MTVRGVAIPALLLCATAWGQDPEPAQPVESTNMSLRVEWSAREVYVGEPVVLTFTWDCRMPLETIRAVDIRIPLLRDKAFREIASTGRRVDSDEGTIGIPVNETRVIGKRQHNQVRFTRTLLPLTEGTYPVAAASVSCAILPRKSRDAFQYPSYFDNQFFAPAGNVRRPREFARTPPATLRVLPLPIAGRPADFSGLVGTCTLETRATPTDLQVGDPITLELLVAGHPHPDIIPTPDLGKDSAFLNNFQFSDDSPPPTTQEGVRIFRYTIRPRHTEIAEISSVMLSFFNAESTSYRTTVSDPIPINVRDAEIANAADAVLSDGTRLRNTVRRHPDGIMQNHAGVPALDARQTVWGLPLGSTFLLLILPPLLYAGVRLATADARLARRDPPAARARRAYRVYRRRMARLAAHDAPPSPGQIAACDAALRDYLADRFDLRAGALTFSDVAAALEARGLTTDERQTLESLMQAHNTKVYGGTGVEPQDVPPPSTLSRVIARLERLFLIMLLLVPAFAAMAATQSNQPALSVPELLTRADAHMQAGHTAEDPDRACEMYEAAAATYQYVLDRRVRNGHLHYNLGNAWYWAGDRGRALLNYRRAELYLPGHADVLHNIAQVRDRARDTVPVPAFARLRQALLFREARINRRDRAWLVACVWTAVWLLLTLALFREDRRLVKAMRFLAVCMAALVVSLLIDAALVVTSTDAVILEREVIGRKGNALVYEPAFNTPLHSGTECRVIETRNNWTRIELVNGFTCWVPSTAVATVR